MALVPSAPPLHCDLETVLAGSGDLLSLEPPTWMPDSHAGDCMACHQAFRWNLLMHHECPSPRSHVTQMATARAVAANHRLTTRLNTPAAAKPHCGHSNSCD